MRFIPLPSKSQHGCSSSTNRTFRIAVGVSILLLVLTVAAADITRTRPLLLESSPDPDVARKNEDVGTRGDPFSDSSGIHRQLFFNFLWNIIKNSSEGDGENDIHGNSNSDAILPPCRFPWFGACVCTGRELLQTIMEQPQESLTKDETSNNNKKNVQRISLCRNSHIFLDSSSGSGGGGGAAIDLSNKAVALRCGGSESLFSWSRIFRSKRSTSTCIIDGKSASRLFFGTNAWLSLQDILLVNGRSMSDATTAINGTNKNGGAMDFVDSHVAIENCLFSNHAAPDGAGGAIHFVGGTLNVTGTEFHNNTAKDGGAVAVKKNATVRIRNSTFRGNQATNAGGAGIFKRGIVIVEDPVFVQNSASTMFGGALALLNVRMNLFRSTFSGNTALTSSSSNDIVVADDDPIGRGGGTALVCLDTVFCNGLDGVTELGIESDNTNCNQQMPNFSMMMSTNSAVWPNSLDGSCLAMNWLTMKKANMRIKVFRSSS